MAKEFIRGVIHTISILHISIKDKYANDDSNWFGWMGKIPKKIKLPRRLPKKKQEK
jgi:hypothetical protein